MSGMLTMLYKIKIYIQGHYKLLCYLHLLCISFSDIFLSFVYVHFLRLATRSHREFFTGELAGCAKNLSELDLDTGAGFPALDLCHVTTSLSASSVTRNVSPPLQSLNFRYYFSESFRNLIRNSTQVCKS
jgi:hypothetical protein